MRLIDADLLLIRLEEYFNKKEQDAKFTGNRGSGVSWNDAIYYIKTAPSARLERLTDDDFETIRIHLNAYKETLCNQRRWDEAEEYQRIIDRFMSFASTQTGQCDDAVSRKLMYELGATCIARRENGELVALGGLDTLPSVTPKMRWIPVSERLPEKRTRVLTCSKDGDIWINDYSPIAPTGWAIDSWAVVAWMPLPEKPKLGG